MVDFKWQLIFAVFAFIKSVIVNFGHAANFVHQQRHFLDYNVLNINATRKSVIYKNFALTKIGMRVTK